MNGILHIDKSSLDIPNLLKKIGEIPVWQKSYFLIFGHPFNETHRIHKKNLSVCILAMRSSDLNQIKKVMSVSKSACSQLFKTVLIFDLWPSRS